MFQSRSSFIVLITSTKPNTDSRPPIPPRDHRFQTNDPRHPPIPANSRYPHPFYPTTTQYKQITTREKGVGLHKHKQPITEQYRDDVIKKGAGLKQGLGGRESNEIVIGIVILGVDQFYANLCLSLIPWEKLWARSTREKKKCSQERKTTVFHFKGKQPYFIPHVQPWVQPHI